MLRIRLKRTGRRHDPSYRLVVVESARSPKSGHYVENLGLYNPRSNTKQINTERAQLWLSRGAQASGTAHNVLVDLGIQTGDKINVLPRKSPIISETSESGGQEPAGGFQNEDSPSETDQNTEQDTENGEEDPAVEETENKSAEAGESEPAQEDSSDKNEAQAV